MIVTIHNRASPWLAVAAALVVTALKTTSRVRFGSWLGSVSRLLGAATCVVAMSVSASAQNLYWDSNGTTLGAGATPTGIWGVDNFWNTDPTGGAGGSFQTGTLSTNDVFFSAGSDAVNPYTVGLNSATQNARLVTFKDGTATLNAGTLSLGNNGGITVTANTVTGATVSSGLTLSGGQTFNVAASRTLTLDTGTFTRNAGATLNVLSTGTVTSTMTGLDSGSLVNGIIGPWASFGTGASTRYATINGSNNIVAYTGGTAAATAANVTSTLGTVNYDVAAVGTLGAGANINTLRYTGGAGTIAGALTTRGIMHVGGGTLTLSGVVTGSEELVLNTANGDIAFSAAHATGTYGLVKTGSGRLNTSNSDTTYSGAVTVNGGVLQYGDTLARLTTGNITLNGGVIEQRWSATNTLTQGSGAGQIRIIGGESGFSENGNAGLTWNIGAVTWGSSTFNPSKFVLQTAASQGASSMTFASAINLNGAERTIIANAGASGTATSTLGGALTGTGASGLIKEGPGILILNVANSYSGNTTISAGTLRIAAADRLGSASNTLIFNGGTLQASGTVTSPSTRAVTMTSTGIIDTNGQAISIAGNIGGAGGLTKNGAGTLTLSGANDYTGRTTVNTGTLSVSAGNNLGAASSNLVINGGTLQITGTSLNTYSGLGRTVVVNPGSTLALDISNVGNTFTFDASLPQDGIALAGAGSVAFQNTVSALTLNPRSGNSYTYSGVIADGAAGMDLIKIGAGTQNLQGANTYTGDTYLYAGTLNLSGTAGSLAGTAGLTFNGGGLTLTSADSTAEDDFDRVNDAATITSNGGTITYTTTTPASTKNFLETLGSVALTSGQLNLVNTLDKTAGSQTLALSGLTRTGATNTSAISFSNAGGLNLTNDRIRVNGITSDTATDEIIGPWATVGAAANSQTDFAVYDSDGTDGYVVARNTAGSAETTWTTATNAYTTSAGGTVTLTGTRTITALRNTGASTVLTLASGNNLETAGVLNGAATLLTIAPGTGGVLTTPTGGGKLYLTTHGGNTDTQGAHTGISVTAPINNNGSDAVTLVKSGVGVLQLNATSSYSGGTVLNSGTLWAQTDASLGNVDGDINFNGSATLLLSPNNGTSALNFTLPSTRSIIVNNGAMATIAGGRANAAITVNGDISGSGGVTTGRVALLNSGGVGTSYNFNLFGNNTFTGEFGVGNGGEGSAGGALVGVTVNSLADSTSPITLNYGSGAFFSLGSSATANLSVPNRPVDLRNSNITIRNQDANNTMTLGSVSTSTAGGKTLNLGDGGFGGFISGSVTNGAGSISVTKSGTGKWTLSNSLNSYTGATTISAGTLEIQGSIASSSNISNSGTLIFNNASAQSYGNAISGNGTLTKNGLGILALAGTNTYTGATTINAGTLAVNGSLAAGSALTVGASGTLAGDGLIGGSVIANGSVAPGNGIGSLEVGGSLTWNGGSDWIFELGPSNTADLLDITSAFTKGTGADGSFVFDFGGSTETGTFALVNFASTNFVDPAAFSYRNLGGSNTGTFNLTSSQLEFVVVVPEPATLALIGAGVALLGLHIARRRRAVALASEPWL